ncbi:hypothetical protein WA1_24815 [Scytonema hofmannii PCC 7110]|uniref:Uncharacterized protein n=1 Tax=Scytonema hofmannii PCC 7110 TaxID=128403 RepID=A0A139X841_9CYAN|nr:hypothetical protein [Scytonema hofmannii]KYC40846.1 hypothetical protein WA1_24815 [Scytonema hofmannii PCC 7110]
MVSTPTKPSNVPPETLLAEQRVIFHNISWPAYEQILAALDESATRLIELFIRILVVELGLKIKTMGSTLISNSFDSNNY